MNAPIRLLCLPLFSSPLCLSSPPPPICLLRGLLSDSFHEEGRICLRRVFSVTSDVLPGPWEKQPSPCTAESVSRGAISDTCDHTGTPVRSDQHRLSAENTAAEEAGEDDMTGDAEAVSDVSVQVKEEEQEGSEHDSESAAAIMDDGAESMMEVVGERESGDKDEHQEEEVSARESEPVKDEEKERPADINPQEAKADLDSSSMLTEHLGRFRPKSRYPRVLKVLQVVPSCW